jgi:hypothetical protein
MDAKEIRELFKRHNVPLSRDDVWEVQGNPVVKHQALERMSSTLGIIWHKPEILRAERDEAVLIVTGNLPSGPAEWSIGEAVVGQNLLARNKTAVYPYAMAEKRAKDRVILKLAGMYGSHSEEEADDFKQKPEPEPEQQAERSAPPTPRSGPSTTFGITKGFDTDVSPQQFGAVPATKDSRSVYVENSLKLIELMQTPEAVSAWLDSEAEKGVWKQYGINEHQEDGKAILMACKKRRLELRNAA